VWRIWEADRDWEAQSSPREKRENEERVAEGMRNGSIEGRPGALRMNEWRERRRTVRRDHWRQCHGVSIDSPVMGQFSSVRLMLFSHPRLHHVRERWCCWRKRLFFLFSVCLFSGLFQISSFLLSLFLCVAFFFYLPSISFPFFTSPLTLFLSSPVLPRPFLSPRFLLCQYDRNELLRPLRTLQSLIKT